MMAPLVMSPTVLAANLVVQITDQDLLNVVIHQGGMGSSQGEDLALVHHGGQAAAGK
jgi:hypothetical protein